MPHHWKLAGYLHVPLLNFGVSEPPYFHLLLLLHLFNGLFPRTTWVRWHQKGKPLWILLEQEMMGLQWHQLNHMQIICNSLQADDYASTSPLSFYKPDALPATQPTASKHWRQGELWHARVNVWYALPWQISRLLVHHVTPEKQEAPYSQIQHYLMVPLGERLCKRIAKHTVWRGRMLWIVVDGRSW